MSLTRINASIFCLLHLDILFTPEKVRRVCDGYLGGITQKKGLIPPKDKLPKVIRSYEYDLSSLILSVCSNFHKGLRRSLYGT